MSVQTKKLDKSQLELTITVAPDQYAKHMEKAGERISGRLAVKGFRKGHVPYDMVKKEVGEMAILQEALEGIVQETYVNAIQDEKLDVIGMPQIQVEKVAPGNDVVYKATVALLPKVTLADTKKIKVKKDEAKVSKEQVQETIDGLRGMHAVEVEKDGAAEGTDKMILDMDMLLDNVPVEGGQAKDYQVYLGEDHYIPGFNDNVKGMKKGEEKEFTLDFPEGHYQKMLAGKTVQFKVKAKQIMSRELPAMDAEFAKKLGQDSVEKLEELINNNLLEQAKQKVNQKAEIDLLDAMIEKSTFEELPDVLVNSERQKIFYELKRDLEKNGITIEQYLQDIKKKEDELFEGFTQQATKRAQAALLSRQVAVEQNIEIDDKDIDAEIELMKGAYAHNKEAQDNLKRPEVRDSIATMLQNKKVMEYLKAQVFGEPADASGDAK